MEYDSKRKGYKAKLKNKKTGKERDIFIMRKADVKNKPKSKGTGYA